MARYIDADKFIERIKVSPAFRNINDGLWLQRVVIDLLNNMPTADVAPKSEGVREVFFKALGVLIPENATLEEAVESYKKIRKITRNMAITNAKAEVAREIFEEIENLFLQYYKGLTNGGELKLLKPIAHAQGFLLNELFGDISELKKKYTENCTTCKHLVSCEPNPFGICDEYTEGDNDRE